MKIKIISISDSDKHFSESINEYIKRLNVITKIENIKPEKHGTKEQIIQSETNKILNKLKKDNNFKVLLSIDGNQFSSENIKELIEQNLNITFIIGGPYGIDEKQIENIINLKIGFGKITLPHGLAKLVLIEQIYRSKMIIDNKKYHY